MCFYQREIQHIHHPAMEETRVSVGRKNFRNMIVGAFFKNKTVEHTVNQIAKGTGENKTRTDDVTVVIVFADQGTVFCNFIDSSI